MIFKPKMILASETRVFADISHGYIPGRLDTCIIDKGKGARKLAICKVDNIVAAFDVPDLLDGEFYALNYKELKTSDEAYDKMMKWIGKMCKKTPNSRYFQHYDPYGHQDSIDPGIWDESMRKKILARKGIR